MIPQYVCECMFGLMVTDHSALNVLSYRVPMQHFLWQCH